jgi:hypothetical protein
MPTRPKTVTPLPTSDQRQWNVEAEKGRVSEYHHWRMDLRVGSVQDIDQIEYTIIDGKVVPLALIELSKVEDHIIKPSRYLPTVDKNRRRQMQVARELAQQLGIPAFYFLYEDGFNRIFLKQLNQVNGGGTWLEPSLSDWQRIICSYHNRNT